MFIKEKIAIKLLGILKVFGDRSNYIRYSLENF
jgi:hypothetical protein